MAPHEFGQEEAVLQRVGRAVALQRRGTDGEMHEDHELLDPGCGEVEPHLCRAHERAQHDDVDEGEAGIGQIDRGDRQARAEPGPPVIAMRPVRQLPAQPGDEQDCLKRRRDGSGHQHAAHGDLGARRGTQQDRRDHRGHHQGLAQEVGRRDGEPDPVLAAGHALQIILEREERHHAERHRDRGPVGRREQLRLEEQESRAEARDRKRCSTGHERAGADVAAGEVEIALSLIGGHEPAGTLRQAERQRVAEHCGPDPDRGEDAVGVPAHQPRRQDLSAIRETGRADADREDRQRHPLRAAAQGAQTPEHTDRGSRG